MWKSAKTLPNDGSHVHVYLDRPHHGSRIHTMRTGNAAVVGSLFVWDVGEILAWRDMVDAPVFDSDGNLI